MHVCRYVRGYAPQNHHNVAADNGVGWGPLGPRPRCTMQAQGGSRQQAVPDTKRQQVYLANQANEAAERPVVRRRQQPGPASWTSCKYSPKQNAARAQIDTGLEWTYYGMASIEFKYNVSAICINIPTVASCNIWKFESSEWRSG